MVETYGSRSSTKHMSRREIQEMKKNMQKVPYIQMKSDMYHEQESQQVDAILEGITQSEIIAPQESMENVPENRYIQWIKKIFRKLGFISES
jgi:hypothetical protein